MNNKIIITSKILALLLSIIMIFSGCGLIINNGDHTDDPDINGNGGNNGGQNGGDDNNNDKPDDGIFKNELGLGTLDPSLSDAQIEKFYSYEPKIADEMPSIRVVTSDGNNSFATKYNRGSKLNGGIPYSDCTVSVESEDASQEITDAVAQIKVRGNYTLEYEKKPFRIKFEQKTSMLGLNDNAECKNWLLMADWKDLAMQNNAVTFFLGQKILSSDGYYCSDYRPVELYLNGSYWGVYLLVEYQQINKNRIDINEVEEGYTGTDIGYFMEYDSYYNEEKVENGGDYTFTMNYGSQKGYTIKSDIYSTKQVDFIKSYMNNVYYIATEAKKGNYLKFNDTFTGIKSSDYTSAEETISKVIDIQSLVDTYIIQEISCDPDIAWSSFYMDVDMSAEGNKKLTFEAPWDYDSAYGVKGVVANGSGMFASTSANHWLTLLTSQSWFVNRVKAKWTQLKKYNVLTDAIDNIDVYSTYYEQNYIKNYTKWQSRVSGGNGEVTAELNSFKDINTAQKNASGVLKRWLTARFKYLDTQWGESSPEVPDVPDTGADKDYQLPAGLTKYRYEAEYALLSGCSVSSSKGVGASNDSHVGNVSGGAGKSLTFTIVALNDTSGYLYIGVPKRTLDFYFNDWFSVTVNGKSVTVPKKYVSAISNGEADWRVWICIQLMEIDLKQGQNTIVFTTLQSNATNVDYIDIYSARKLS